MHKQTLERLEAEPKEIFRIEQFMKYSVMTLDDEYSLKKLATSNIPRAEYLYGVYKFAIERNMADGHIWLKRCKRHCNKIYLKKIAYIVKIIPMWGKYGF